MPEHYDLETFRRHFDWKPRHHVAAFGPTGLAGKSTLLLQLLGGIASEEIRPTVLVMKHRDRVVSRLTGQMGFRETPSWPPDRRLREVPALGGTPPRGYVLWPPQTLTDVDADNLRLAREFTTAITHNRKHTPSVTFADELYGLLAELNRPKDGYPMRQLLTAVVTRDSIAEHSLWYAAQKPSGTQGISIPGFFFSSAEHMFFSKDGEERNRRRYGEIACGINDSEIERQTLNLDPFSWLYIRRTGPQWAIVDAYDERLKV